MKIKVLIAALAITFASLAGSVQPVSAGSATTSGSYTGCNSFSYSVVDHTLLRFVAYKFTMSYHWCWQASTITSYSQLHSITNMDALYNYEGLTHHENWFTSFNVPWVASSHGGLHSSVHATFSDQWGWPFPLTVRFHPYIETNLYAGGNHWSTSGGVR